MILYELNKSTISRGLLDYDREISESVMKTIDKINNRYGSNKLRIAAEGLEKRWQMKREKVSPCYTTRFEDLITVKC